MYNLTQTTGNQSSQGRTCPTTTSLDKPGCVDTLVQQVLALCPAPTQEAICEQAEDFSAGVLEGAGQRACTVPTSATNRVSVSSSTSLFYHRHHNVEMFLPAGSSTFIPPPRTGRDFPCRFVKRHSVFSLIPPRSLSLVRGKGKPILPFWEQKEDKDR